MKLHVSVHPQDGKLDLQMQVVMQGQNYKLDPYGCSGTDSHLSREAGAPQPAVHQ